MKIKPVPGETTFFKEKDRIVAVAPNLVRTPYIRRILNEDNKIIVKRTFSEAADAWRVTLYEHTEPAIEFETGTAWRRGGMRNFEFEFAVLYDVVASATGVQPLKVSGWHGDKPGDTPTLKDYLMLELLLRKLGVLK